MLGILFFSVIGYLAAKKKLSVISHFFWKAFGGYVVVTALLILGQMNPYQFNYLTTDQYRAMISDVLPLIVGGWIASTLFRSLFYFLFFYGCRYFFNRKSSDSSGKVNSVQIPETSDSATGQSLKTDDASEVEKQNSEKKQ